MKPAIYGMSWVSRVVTLLALVTLGALVAASGCSSRTPAVPDVPVATDSVPSTGTAASTAPSPEATTSGTGNPGSAPQTPTTMTVRLYWVEAGENALGVTRTVPYSKGVATTAMNALLAGPTAQEQATWPAISSAIPAGTKLLGLTIAGGVAKVDLSSEFESGGGTFSVTARLAQVVYTLDQFSTIDAVDFYIEGKKVELFSSEGIELNGPQKSRDYEKLLPVDA